MSAFRKEVSGSEKFMIAYNELRPPFVIQLVLEGDGDVEPEQLHDALERCTAANPGSSMRLEENGTECAWVLGPAPTLTVVDAPDFTCASEENAPFFMWPLDSSRGPTCELVQVRGKSNCYLIFRALHAVMDGQGTILWVKDFMRCLRGEAPIGHPSTLSVDALLREIKTDRRPLPDPDALHPFGKASTNASNAFHWRRVHLDRKLDSAATGRIAVGLAREARLCGEGKVRINIPTDLRHYRSKEKTTGNLFNGLFVEVGPDDSPEMVGMKIVKMLYQHEGKTALGIYGSDEVGSLAIHRVKVFWDLNHLHDLGRYAFSATLSHLGSLKSAHFSAPAFHARSALFVPLVGDSGCVIHVNGFDDHVEATAGLSARFPGIERLTEIVREALA